MTTRPTASTITDVQLDALYERLAKAEHDADVAIASAAHLTTLVGKRSERAEQAAEKQQRRADIAEKELHVLRSGLRANGADPTQIQNLWAQIRMRNRQWREEKQRAEQAEGRLQHLGTTSEAAGILLTRTTDERDQLRATLARVRKAIDSVKAAGHSHTPTNPHDKGVAATVDWVTTRVLEAIDARLVHDQPKEQPGA